MKKEKKFICEIQKENNMLTRINKEERANREVWFQEGKTQTLEKVKEKIDKCINFNPEGWEEGGILISKDELLSKLEDDDEVKE